MTYRKAAILFFIAFFCVIIASAQGFMARAEQPVLKALDLNADGVLSADEIQSSPESRLLFKQHDAAWIPDGVSAKGDISVFINGLGRPQPAYTGYIELTLPTRGDTYSRANDRPYGPAGPDYEFHEFAGDPPERFFAPFMSGARRLPNGNIFGVSGLVSGIFEVTEEGEEVLRAVPGGGAW
jgi:hypothetical protein